MELFLPLHLRRDFQAQGVEPDEAGGVVLVAGADFEFHRGHCRISTTAGNGEIFGEDDPAFMVFPAAANLDHPPR